MVKSYKCTQSTKVTIQQYNYHVMETIRRKKITKKSVFRRYQAQLTGWMNLMIFTQITHS